MTEIKALNELSPDDAKINRSIYFHGNDVEKFMELMSDEDIIIVHPHRENLRLRDTLRWQGQVVRYTEMRAIWISKDDNYAPRLMDMICFANESEPLFVGIGVGYPYSKDVIYKIKSIRPNIGLVDTLERLSRQVKEYIKEND